MARALAAVLATAVAAWSLAGCGGDDGNAEDRASESAAAAASESSASAAAEASKSAELEQARQERIAQERAEYNACKRFVGGFNDGLQEIDSRLTVGLNYDEYGDFLGDVQVEYDAFVDGITQDTVDCTRAVGLPLERAYRKYLRVHRIWGDCIDDYYCDFSEGETNRTVQAAWADATQLIDRANRKLEGMAPAQ